MVFYRIPIDESKQPKSTNEPRFDHDARRAASSAAAILTAASTPSPLPQSPGDSRPIFGSVSTNDIAESINTLVNSNEVEAQVVSTPDDVQMPDQSVLGAATEASKIKALGDYVIRIHVKGLEQHVQRTVSVRPIDSAPSQIGA